MTERVLATIRRYNMFTPGQRVGVAVSGGADSVALLHVLVESALELDISLCILHLDHMLRGEESRQDADFVRDLGDRLGIFVHFCALDVARTVAETGENLEQAARHARYGFLEQFLAAASVDRIALGHTLSDQAETVLFRFLRGSGTAGLAGIRPITASGFVRPLIEVDRTAIEQYLRQRDIPWREDSSNRQLDFARNRIRHELLPKLARDWNPSLTETLARTAEWAQAEESWWDREITRIADRTLRPGPGFVLLKVGDLAELPLAVARRLVRRAIEQAKGDLRSIGFDHIEAILALAGSAEGSGRLQIPGLDVYRSFEWVRFAKPGLDTLENRNFRFALAVPGTVEVPGSTTVIHLEVMPASDCGYNKEMKGLDWGRVSGALELRNWRPGDQYRPAGHHGPVKIKTLFQESRIPLWERRNWPVIARGDDIIWVRRFGPAVEYQAGEESQSILFIREAV